MVHELLLPIGRKSSLRAESVGLLLHAQIISGFQAEVKLEKELDIGVDLVYYSSAYISPF